MGQATAIPGSVTSESFGNDKPILSLIYGPALYAVVEIKISVAQQTKIKIFFHHLAPVALIIAKNFSFLPGCHKIFILETKQTT